MNPLFCEGSVYILIHRFLDSETFPPNFTGLQRQNYKECVIVLKHVGLTVRAQAGMSALPTLGFSDMDMEV